MHFTDEQREELVKLGLQDEKIVNAMKREVREASDDGSGMGVGSIVGLLVLGLICALLIVAGVQH